MKFSILFSIFVVFQVFKSANSFTINCDYSSSSITYVGFVYRCWATNISTNAGINVTGASGQHLNGRVNDDVDAISIYGNNTLSFFPRNLGNFYRKVKAFTITETRIERLFGDEFNELTQLEYINFSNSNLTTISSRLLEKTPKLRFVLFPFNRIERVGYDLFTPFNMLQLYVIDFSSNVCINHDAPYQNLIVPFINELREKCPFPDEFPTTTTTTLSTTTTSVSTTTGTNLICTDESIENFVCCLKDSMNEVQENLTINNVIIENLQSELAATRSELNQTKDELNRAIARIDELANIQELLRVKREVADQTNDEIQSAIKEIKNELDNVNSRIQLLEIQVLKFTLGP